MNDVKRLLAERDALAEDEHACFLQLEAAVEALERIAAHSQSHINDDPYPGGVHFAEYAREVAEAALALRETVPA